MKSPTILLLLVFVASSSAIDVRCLFMKANFGGQNLQTCFTEAVQESIACDNPEELQIVNECDLPPGTNVSDIESIYSKDKEWPDFPRNLFKRFPKLKAITLENANLKNLRSTFFINLPQLNFVHFPRNKFTGLQGRLFRHNPNMRSINFRGNPDLKNIGFNIFGSLRYLRDFDFSGIGCSGSESFASNNSSMFSRIASQLMRTCPPEEEDLAEDMENMECTFDTDKSSRSKEKSKGN